MKTAMILAAGRGERLKPITWHVPKAMCEVKGMPLIEHHVATLAKAGFQRLIINHAYLGGQIRRYLGNGSKWNIEILYSPEPSGGLETGGGIFNALPLLGKEPFVTVNADIYTNFDFQSLTLPNHSLVHLILGKKPDPFPNYDFGLDLCQLSNENKRYIFLGIACYHPKAFQDYAPGRYSVVPMLRRLADQKRASGEVFQGLWIDIGTPERLTEARDLKEE